MKKVILILLEVMWLLVFLPISAKATPTTPTGLWPPPPFRSAEMGEDGRGSQFCYVKHHSLTAQGGSDYPLNAMFELVHAYPRSSGVGEGQSAWVLLNEEDMAFVSSLNTPGFMRWAVTQDKHGSLYDHTKKGTLWFPIILSGNIVEITEVEHGRGQVAALAAGPLNPQEINRDNTPYFVSWVPVIWKDGRITNTPKGYGVMPIFNPSQYTSHAIEDIWVNMSDLLCPIDLSQSYKTSIASWVTLGLRVHWEPSLASAVSTKLYPPASFWVWQTRDDGNVTWALTDWGWAVIRRDGWSFTDGR